MSPTTSRQRSLSLFLIALLSVVWFWMLGILPLMHPDEGRYAEIPREMVATGDWITPRLNGLLYFEKPALQYWLTAISYKVFGESGFSARLSTGLAGFFCIIMVWLCSRRLWDEQVARYAALVCGSMLWMQGLGHTLTLDMTLTFFLTLSLCAFLVAHSDDASKNEQRYGMWLVWVGMAGAMLTKGLVGPLIPGTTLFLYSLLTRQWSLWLRMRWVSGLLLFLALTLPWFIEVSRRNPGFAEFFFIHEHFARYLTPEAKRTGPIWYFIPFLLLGLLPWTSLLPRILREAWSVPPGRFQPKRLLLIWCGFVFVFFSISSSKLASYILPMFPALSMLAGISLRNAETRQLRWHLLLPAVFWLVPVAVIVTMPHVIEIVAQRLQDQAGILPDKFQTVKFSVAAAALIFAGLAAICFVLFRNQKKDSGLILFALAGVIMANVVLYAVHFGGINLRSSLELTKSVAPQLGEQTPVFSVGYYDQTMPFYLKRTLTLVGYSGELQYGEQAEPDRWIQKLPDFVQRWNSLSSAGAVMKPKIYESMVTQGLPMRVIYQDPSRVFVVKP